MKFPILFLALAILLAGASGTIYKNVVLGNNLSAGGFNIVSLANGSLGTDAVTLAQMQDYVEDNAPAVDLSDVLNKSTGGTMAGAIAMGGNGVTDLPNATSAQDAATYVQLLYAGDADTAVYQVDGYTIAAYRNGSIIESGVTGAAVNTAVIRAAINSTPDNGTLDIHRGRYLLNADLNCSGQPGIGPLVPEKHYYWTALPIQHNIHIRGDGINSTILQYAPDQYNASADRAALLVLVYGQYNRSLGLAGYTPGPDSFSMQDMTLDGDRANQTDGYWDCAGLISDSGYRDQYIFRNLRLQNSPAFGIYLSHQGWGWDNHTLIENIWAYNCYCSGVVLDSLESSYAHNIWVEDCGEGVNFQSVAYLNALGEHDKWSTLDGIHIKNGYLEISLAENLTVRGVEICNTGSDQYYGIFAWDCRNLSVIDTKIRTPFYAGTHSYGLLFRSCLDVLIQDAEVLSDYAITATNVSTYYDDPRSTILVQGAKITAQIACIYAYNSEITVQNGVFYAPWTGYSALAELNGDILLQSCTGNHSMLTSTTGTGSSLRSAGCIGVGVPLPAYASNQAAIDGGMSTGDLFRNTTASGAVCAVYV